MLLTALLVGEAITNKCIQNSIKDALPIAAKILRNACVAYYIYLSESTKLTTYLFIS